MCQGAVVSWGRRLAIWSGGLEKPLSANSSADGIKGRGRLEPVSGRASLVPNGAFTKECKIWIQPDLGEYFSFILQMLVESSAGDTR